MIISDLRGTVRKLKENLNLGFFIWTGFFILTFVCLVFVDKTGIGRNPKPPKDWDVIFLNIHRIFNVSFLAASSLVLFLVYYLYIGVKNKNKEKEEFEKSLLEARKRKSIRNKSKSTSIEK